MSSALPIVHSAVSEKLADWSHLDSARAVSLPCDAAVVRAFGSFEQLHPIPECCFHGIGVFGPKPVFGNQPAPCPGNGRFC